MSHYILNLGWNGFGSNLTGWVEIGAENLPREELYLRHSVPSGACP